MKSRPHFWEWGTLILLFLGLRLGGLALFHPAYSNLFPIEEYYRGALGHELLRGLSMPYWHYRADNFGGGSLVMGILVAGFFKVFGSSAFVLKSIPVFISLAALTLWFQILYQEFSGKCAWYFALFFIFAPSGFQCYSMAPLGDHYETIFFSALALSLSFPRKRESIFNKNRRSKMDPPVKPGDDIIGLLLLGLLCGFGVWFAYIFALTVAALILLWFRKNPRLLATREFWIFVAGFIVGFLPWIFVNLQDGFSGLVVGGIPIWKYFRVSPPWNLQTLFVRDIFSLFLPPAGGWSSGYFAIKYLYIGLLIAPFVVCFFLRLQKDPAAQSQSDDISFYFGIYALIHCGAIQFTNFQGERYMMPLMPAIFFGWARVMESLESFSDTVRKAARVFFALPIFFLGGILWASMISPFYAGHLLKTKGYAYDYLSAIPVCGEIHSCIGLHREISEKLSPEDQTELWGSFAERVAAESIDAEDPFFLKEAPFSRPDFAASFYFHFGRLLFERFDANLAKASASLRANWNEKTPEFQLGMRGMIHAFGNYPIFESMNLSSGNMSFEALGIQYTYFWRRKGVRIQELYKISNRYASRWNVEGRKKFFQGMGYYLIQNMYHMPVMYPKDYARVAKIFSEADQESFFQGMGEGYETSRRFFPAAYKSWIYLYADQEKDSKILHWIEQGRSEIREITNMSSPNALIGDPF